MRVNLRVNATARYGCVEPKKNAQKHNTFQSLFLKLIRTVIHTQMYPFESPSEGGEGETGKRACTLRWGPTRSGRRSRALVFLSLSLLAGAGGRGKGS